MRNPRWEIVRTDDGWHARFIASNGQKIVSSEVYARRRGAFRAMELVCQFVATDYRDGVLRVVYANVDERTTP